MRIRIDAFRLFLCAVVVCLPFLMEACPGNTFRCHDYKKCIPRELLCDHHADCEDDSDELDCKYKPCPRNTYRCRESRLCVPYISLCNGTTECPNGEDEGGQCAQECPIQSMEGSRRVCEVCHTSPEGPICSCPEGKILADGTSMLCIGDHNMCREDGRCDQRCVSSYDSQDDIGRFTCECYEGYSLQREGCQYTGTETPYVIYVRRHDIHIYNMRTGIDRSLVSGLRNSVSLDFDHNNGYIYWTDMVDDTIYRGTVDSSSPTSGIRDTIPFINYGLATPEGIAVDWIGHNIYWTHETPSQIEVADMSGKNRKTLISRNIKQPRAIALDPRDGLLFWSDWDATSPLIERVTMAGLDRKIIVNISDVSGGWPNGMTLDLWERKVYWIDAKSDSLHSCYYNGSHITWVLQMNSFIDHPFAVTIFEDRVYWTDWRYNGVFSANKWTGKNAAEVQRMNTQPFGIQVFHPTKQPTAINPCTSSPCSHLCLINSDPSYLCACPYLMELGDDQQNCINTTSFLVFAKASQIHGVHINSMENVIPVLSNPPELNLTSVDHDVVMDHIYFTNIKRKVVGRVNIHNLEVESVMEGLTNAHEVAVDWISRNIYVMMNSDEGNTIFVSSVDGNYPSKINVELTEFSHSLTLDPANGYMYWVNGNEEENTPSINRAEMNGDNLEILLSNVHNPKGLALDRETMTLYWIDIMFAGGKPGIFYSPVNSPSSQQLPCEFSGDDVPQSIAVHQGRIYWFDNGVDMIRAVDISNPTEVMNLLQTSESIKGRMFVYDTESKIGDINGCSIDNGGCNQLCIPKPTSNPPRVCACTTGYTLRSDETTCIGEAEFVIYSTTTSIRGISMDVDNDEPQFPPIMGQRDVQSVDFHAEEGMIYWVDADQQNINRIKRDHTGEETVISTDRDQIGTIAIDPVSGNIYWTDQRRNTINVARINTWKEYVVIGDSLGSVKSIALDPIAGYLFWMTGEPDQPSVYRTGLDGSNHIRIFSDTFIAPKSLAINEGKLYICENDRITRTDLNGHNQEIVFTSRGTDQYYSISKITVGKQFVYWIDSVYQSGSILRVDKRQSEGEIELLQDNIISGEGMMVTDITIYSKDLQSGSNLCTVENGGCEQLCFFKGGSDKKCACANGKLADDNFSCNPYDVHIIYSGGKRIEIVPVGDEDHMGSVETVTTDENIVGIASAFPQKGVFYSDIYRGVLMFKSMEDQSESVTILEDTPSVEGIAFNHITNELFWTSYANSSIKRMAVFTTQPAVQHLIFSLGADDHPRGITLDVCRGDMFWTNWNEQRPSIMKSTMSGDNLREIINTDIQTPNGIVIDPHPSKLYWCDARLDKIERADLDGSHREVIFVSRAMHPFGIAVHGDFLYWTDWLTRNLTRVNKYDGGNVRVVQSHFTYAPMGISVFSEPYKCEDMPCSRFNGGCDDQCEVDEYGDIFCSCTQPGTSLYNDRRRCVRDDKEPCDGFLCGQGGCISNEHACDGQDDCSDGSDEFESFCRCPPNQFECRFGECIEESRQCDHVKDCSNALDERDCGPFNCSNWVPDHVDQREIGLYENCFATSVCVKSSDRCDGFDNCGDNSDEEGCRDDETNTCKNDEMICEDDPTICIFIHQKCDGRQDCPGASDERNCP